MRFEGDNLLLNSPYKRTFTRMGFRMLPYAALTWKMFSTQFALILALSQVFRLVGNHLLVGIKALSNREIGKLTSSRDFSIYRSKVVEGKRKVST